MSTILDALSKAEQERKLGALPDLHFPPAFPGPARNRRTRRAAWWLVPAAGLIGVSVWWWMAGPAADSDGRLPVPAASVPMPDARPQPEVGAPTSGFDVANGAAGQTTDSARSAAATEKLKGAGTSARPATSEASAGSRPPLRSGIEWSTQKSAAELRKPKQSGQLKPPPTPEVQAVATADAGAAIPSKVPASPAGDARKAPLAHELPADIRGQLPQLRIGGYIYSSKPAERSVLINNKLLHEGESVSPGLQLEQLLPDGVLLNYRGHRYRVGY